MSSERLFISHAAADKPLANLFQRFFILSGVPRERIFYSSARDTGIPAGRGSREFLKETLRGKPFVIELITKTFLQRPMCLMELGAAWVLDVPTFPIVVPPLQRSEVISQIGDVHLPHLGETEELDDLFDELHDRVQRDLGVPLSSTGWNPAVRSFKAELATVIQTVQSPAPRPKPEAVRAAETHPESTQLTDALVASRLDRLDTAYSTDVVGRLTNTSSTPMTVILLSATFFDTDGRIVGTASGPVNGLPAGATKSFRLNSVGVVPDVASFSVQVDAQM